MSINTEKCYLVYLASNAEGLNLERYEIQRLMSRYGMVDVGFSCRDDAAPYDWSLVRVQIERSDLFVLLLGDDYGPMTPTGISCLHREFVHAKTLGKPILSFIKNALPSKNLTEDQRRLEGFQRIVMQQANYKLWHLRDELLSHVRISLPGVLPSLGRGWVREELPAPAAPILTLVQNDMSSRERQTRLRETVGLKICANVYRGGNLALEEVLLPTRLDQLMTELEPLFAQGASVHRLRAQIERVLAPTVKGQLLQMHATAHAVDDVRLNRQQFQDLLNNWQELRLISSRGEGIQTFWHMA